MSSEANPAICQVLGEQRPYLKAACDKFVGTLHPICVASVGKLSKYGLDEAACNKSLEALDVVNKTLPMFVGMIDSRPEVKGPVNEVSSLVEEGIKRAQATGWCKAMSGSPQDICFELEGAIAGTPK